MIKFSLNTFTKNIKNCWRDVYVVNIFKYRRFYHEHAVQEFRQYTPLNNMLLCKLRLAVRNIFFSSLIAGCRYIRLFQGIAWPQSNVSCTMPKVRPIVRGKVVNHIKTFFLYVLFEFISAWDRSRTRPWSIYLCNHIFMRNKSL